MPVKRVAVLVSGSGSNLQKLIDHQDGYQVELVVSDKEESYGLERAKSAGIEAIHLDLSQAENYSRLLDLVEDMDLVVLAGYMRILPKDFVQALEGRIINLHPSILPKHGGMGMHGLNVHQAVLEAGEPVTGASVHYVDSGVDTGEVIDCQLVNVYHGDSPQSLQERVQRAEHIILPKVVSKLLKGK